jgi:hypothetical protein
MDDRQQKTYDAIVARCTDLIPPVDIATHIKPGTLRVANNTLDGITFEAVDPADLEAELSGRMKLPGAGKSPKPGEGALSFDTTRGPRPANASMIGMKEDPKHWALKASFGATVGRGSASNGAPRRSPDRRWRPCRRPATAVNDSPLASARPASG